jgi:hypothetical protein
MTELEHIAQLQAELTRLREAKEALYSTIVDERKQHAALQQRCAELEAYKPIVSQQQDELAKWKEAHDALQARLAQVERIILDEPELPGDMPEEMWQAIRADKETAQEAMRIAVRKTKQNILDRLQARPASGGGA